MTLGPVRSLALVAGPVLAVVVLLVLLSAGYSRDIAVTGLVAAWCVAWWIFEPVPIPVTSLLPLAVLPLMGVLTPTQM